MKNDTWYSCQETFTWDFVKHISNKWCGLADCHIVFVINLANVPYFFEWYGSAKPESFVEPYT